MSPPSKKSNLLFWILLISSDTAAQMLIKVGANRLQGSGEKINLFILAGYGLIFVSFFAWVNILKTVRLLVAQALSALLYVSVALASFFFLHEPITFKIACGTALISLGVFIIGFRPASQRKLCE